MDSMLPDKYQGLTEKELRKEYMRLRLNVMRRLRNLEKAGYERTAAYRFAQSRLSLLPQSELSLRDLKYELYDLDVFVNYERSTVLAARQAENKQIKALQKTGFSWIQSRNDFQQFVDYMEYARTLSADRIVGSATVADKLREWEDDSKTPEEIRGELLQWLGNEARAQEQARALADIYRKSLGI